MIELIFIIIIALLIFIEDKTGKSPFPDMGPNTPSSQIRYPIAPSAYTGPYYDSPTVAVYRTRDILDEYKNENTETPKRGPTKRPKPYRKYS